MARPLPLLSSCLWTVLVYLLLLLPHRTAGWQTPRPPVSERIPQPLEPTWMPSRRESLAGASLFFFLFSMNPSHASAKPNGLPLQEASGGFKWADAKVGTGNPPKSGATVSIDYSMASTAGRFPQIYTTKEKGNPYRFTLGDGSTIAGIELAILGDDSQGIPPMRPGGIRRVIVPQALGYQSLMKAGTTNAQCTPGNPGSIGPIPPKEDDMGAYYQRWYQFYCNPRIPYQPDLVLDIKLYGAR